MKYAIRYYSKTGNTKKLADEAARILNVEVFATDAPLTENVDILFLGSSVYGAGVDNQVINFIKNNHDKIGQIVNLSTAALLPSTYKQVKKLAEENGIKMCEKEFHCRGSFGVMHKNHPDANDLSSLADFLKDFQ